MDSRLFDAVIYLLLAIVIFLLLLMIFVTVCGIETREELINFF